ncbi:hypothetical protein AMATHDRAFT_69586 [Amanita thiersii Skay4041]|uniref:Uncharacterized protein n=1 Tax=Amanita thiersii Skay4041 TaxID=703135 RepID=A0A2A9NFX9_9AGAR|nr:hypothetical protein AMATHDRAFT_69586 [Amanita thiersii Skay4041]
MPLNYFYDDTSLEIQYNGNWIASRNATSNSTYHMAIPGAICIFHNYDFPVSVVGFIEGPPGDEWTFEFTVGSGLPDTRTLRSDGTGNHRLFYQTPRLTETRGNLNLQMRLTSSPNITGLDEARSANLVGFMGIPVSMSTDNFPVHPLWNDVPQIAQITYSPGWGRYSGSDSSLSDLYIPPSQGVATLMFNGTGVLPIVFYNYSHPFNITAFIDNETIPSSVFTPRLQPDPLAGDIVQKFPLFQYSGLPPRLHNLTIVYTSPQNDTIPGPQFAFGLDHFLVSNPWDTYSQDQSGITAGTKGGIAAGSIAFVCLIILGILLWRKRRSRKRTIDGAINPFQNLEPTVVAHATNLLKESFGREDWSRTTRLLCGFGTKRANVQLGPANQVPRLPGASSGVLNEANAAVNGAEQNPGRNDENRSRGEALGERSGDTDEPPAYQEHV